MFFIEITFFLVVYIKVLSCINVDKLTFIALFEYTASELHLLYLSIPLLSLWKSCCVFVNFGSSCDIHHLFLVAVSVLQWYKTDISNSIGWYINI